MGMFPGVTTHKTSTSFQVGDVVVLKSGGPKMSVHISHSGQTHCVWFGDQPYRETFHSCFADTCLELSK